MYQIPDEHFLRLHFSRSRFSRTLEDTLLVLAEQINTIGVTDKKHFSEVLDSVIRGTNEIELADKTIHNQRTEMIRLFGLAKYSDEVVVPGTRLVHLHESQDIPRFFKSFCKKFQYPGGFLKPDKVKEIVQSNVKFKPAKTILKLLKTGVSKHGQFAVSAAEITHFVFNDKRVTAENEIPGETIKRIEEFRENGDTLDTGGDVIRYARDFLNYMVLANLLDEFKGMYSLNNGETKAISSIISDRKFFGGYDEVIDGSGEWNVEEYKKVDETWMDWFADIDPEEDEKLNTPASALIKDDIKFPDQWKNIREILDRKDPVARGEALKDIGDEGESIVLEYEKDVVRENCKHLLPQVKLVSDVKSLGYDVISVEPDGSRTKKYIEVKTTKKNFIKGDPPFTISINEWSVAQQHTDSYYIYRVIITREGVAIFEIKNPFQKYKDGKLVVEPLAYKVVYSSDSGMYLDLKTNKKTKNNLVKNPIQTVSLFSGCGGSDLGLLGGFRFAEKNFPKLRFSIEYANDINLHAAETYKKNIGDHIDVSDINEVGADEIPNHDFLIGGFPCQSFSIAGQRKGLDDERGELYMHMVKILHKKKPRVFVAENVKGILSVDGGKAFEKIFSDFESAGYKIKYKIINASDYGVPQKRERVFVVGIRNDIKKDFEFPSPVSHRVVLGDVLQSKNEIDQKYFFSERAHEGLKRANKAFNKGRAQDVCEPCNTISTHLAKASLNGTDPVISIGKDKYRRLTPLEAARIQSFPDEFEFVGSDAKKYIQIGNAIPPVAMWHIAKAIQQQIF